jgi:hypothetical protein
MQILLQIFLPVIKWIQLEGGRGNVVSVYRASESGALN